MSSSSVIGVFELVVRGIDDVFFVRVAASRRCPCSDRVCLPSAASGARASKANTNDAGTHGYRWNRPTARDGSPGSTRIAARSSARRWSLTIQSPSTVRSTCVGRARHSSRPDFGRLETRDATHGSRAGDRGIGFWNGDPDVRLLDADDDLDAMLLERCEPGTSLRAVPEPIRTLSSRSCSAACGACLHHRIRFDRCRA